MAAFRAQDPLAALRESDDGLAHPMPVHRALLDEFAATTNSSSDTAALAKRAADSSAAPTPDADVHRDTPPLIPAAAAPTSAQAMTAADPDTSYAIVLDAGSSGTRVQVYSVRPSTTGSRLPRLEPALHPTLHDWQLKTEPGISSYATHPGGLRTALIPLLQFAAEIVPARLHGTTPVRVMATAGMRLLSLADQATVIDAVCGVLKDFAFAGAPQGCHATVRVISGENEGMFGWLALNYLAGTLAAPADAPPATLGFLDMGGASTQIAFARPIASPADLDTTTGPGAVHRPGAPYRILHLPALSPGGAPTPVALHVTTFLGMGTNEARKTHVRLLTNHHASTTSVPDPCLPRGLTVTAETNAYHPDGPVSLVGLGDWDACRALAEGQLIHEHGCPGGPPCLVRGGEGPAVVANQTFVGVSEYWYSTYDLLGMGGGYVPEALREASTAFCAMPWAGPEHNAAERAGVTRNRLRDQCFKSAWIDAVLHVGFGMPSHALPPAFDPARDAVCPVPETAVLGVDHTPKPPPAHVAAGWHLPKFGKEKPAAAACTRPDIRVLTSDHVGDMQITWTLGSLLLDHLPSPPVPPPSPAAVGGSGGAWRSDTRFTGADPLALTSALLLLALVLAVAWTHQRRRARSPAAEAYYTHYYAGAAGLSPLARARYLVACVRQAVHAALERVGLHSQTQRRAQSHPLLSPEGSGAGSETTVAVEASSFRMFDQQGGAKVVNLRGMV
ncbi:Golgi apyrase [Blastocladiella emersonii ATCC 22665]|nr:Golgi apyrase [Blastocladiella emersonii ATCC 22665]